MCGLILVHWNLTYYGSVYGTDGFSQNCIQLSSLKAKKKFRNHKDFGTFCNHVYSQPVYCKGSFKFYYNASAYLNKETVNSILAQQKQAAFSSEDPLEIIRYAEAVDAMFWDPRVKELISIEDILTYEELAAHIRRSFVLTINKNGQGGYYDAQREEYKGSIFTDQNLTTHSAYYSFFGDFMVSGSTSRVYRPTGENWEEELLSKYDTSTVRYYYKDTEVFGGEQFPYELQTGEVYVCSSGDGYYVFIIQPDRILGRSGVGFDLDYSK